MVLLLAGIHNHKSYSRAKYANKFASTSIYGVYNKVIRSRSGWKYGESYHSHSRFDQYKRAV